MSFGLVIPVWNDQAALTQLLDQVCQMDIFEQVVVIDDGSDVPVVLPALPGIDVHLVRNAVARGAGPARNIGLEHITTQHVLFFDSDDQVTPELALLWHDLQDQHFDFCIFRHCDSRQMHRGHWGMMGHDTGLWRTAGVIGKALQTLTAPAEAQLAQTSNFPWNKIWRTKFLHDHNIRYSDIRVHEDIVPHWMGFLHANTILASDRVAALHYVSSDADRLTNVQGPERLAVFAPLEQVMSYCAVAPDNKSALRPAFVRFTCDLLDWIHGNLDSRWHGDLSAKRRVFWQTAVPPIFFDQLAAHDPALALHMTLQMMKEPVQC